MNLALILFVVCVVAVAWRWHNARTLRRPQTDSSPPPPDPGGDPPVSRLMMSRCAERAFLRLLIANDASRASLQLQDRLAQAEHDERCLRRALFLMVLLFMLSVAGLTYCGILLPETLRHPRPVGVRGLGYLALASLVSFVTFVGYSLWQRAAKSRLHGQCRLLVLANPQVREGTAPRPAPHRPEAVSVAPGAWLPGTTETADPADAITHRDDARG